MINKNLHKKIITAIMVITCIIAKPAKLLAVQLSGTYTIDSAGTPSTTVFRDFNSAIIYMTGSGTRPDGGPSNSSPFGVSGPVVFMVMQGTYTEQVNIPAITGASATNTITFDGGNGNAATRILQFSASSSTDAHTLRFSSCSWVNVRNITVRALNSTAGIAVHFFGANTANNSVRNCRLFSAISTSTSVRTVVVSNSNVSSTVTACGSSSASGVTNIFIDSNYIFGGQNGVQLGGSSNSSGGPHNFYVRWNTIESASVTGIYASSTQGYMLHGNYIKMLTGQSTSKGIHHCNGSTSGSHHYVITGNIIENAGQYGIHFQSNNANTNVNFPTIIANNYIKPTFINASSFGMDFSQARNHKIYNNTIIMNITNGVGINLGSSANANCAIKNNIIILRAPNSSNLCIASTGSNVDSAEYNVYIKNNPDPATNILTLRGSTFNKLNFRGGLGMNFFSSLDDPMLQSDSIPRPANICQRGERLWYVTQDLFGDTRPNPPQIGCLEGSGGIPLDASVIDIIEPATYPVVAGTQTVKVRIKNNGTATLTSASVSVQLGSTVNTVLYTGSLPTCQIDTVTFSGSNALTLLTGQNTIRAWISLSGDTINTNDTVQANFCTPLQTGTYTLDTGTGDFKSFSEIAAVLNCGGVIGTGTVEIVVSRGIYNNEQLNLSGVNGLGPNTRILFRSADNNADSVELNFTANNTSNNFVVRLANVSYITFRDMTFRSLGTSFGRVFEVSGAPVYDSIYNCKLIMPSVATTSNNLTGIFANPVAGKLNYIGFNLIQGGAIGIDWSATAATLITDSNTIINNRFVNQYYSAIWTQFNYNSKFINNTINPNTAYTFFNGIYCVNSNFVEVANNSITPWNGGYGYFFSGVNGNSVNPSRIYNNTLAGGLTGTSYGLYMSSCTFTEVYHNTIWLTGTATSSWAAYLVLTSTTNTSTIIRNNIFANNGSGASNYAAYIWAPNTVNSDNNNLFCNGPNLIQQASPSQTYPNIFAWRTASNFEKNSVSYRPGLMSNTSAVPNPNDSSSWINNGRAIYLNPYYQMDLNGNPRPLNRFQGAPDLGAYEFTPTSIPPMATFNPATLAADSTTSFMFGGDTVAAIKWPQFGFPPTSGIEVRQYRGVKHPNIDTTLGHMNFYTRITGPFGSYQYDLSVKYRAEWLANITNESSIRLARRDTAGFFGWQPFTMSFSSVDTVNRNILVNSLFDMNYDFTGTDNLNPLPVQLTSFKATRNRDNVLLEWTTAQEINSQLFVVERSFNNRNFEPIASVKAAGNSNRILKYSAVDYNPMSVQNAPVVYYRLKMIDRDNSFEYSNTVALRFENRGRVVLYPNPFVSNINITIENETADKALIEVYDITGSRILTKYADIESGVNHLSLNELSANKSGIYLIKVFVNNNENWYKLIKE